MINNLYPKLLANPYILDSKVSKLEKWFYNEVNFPFMSSTATTFLSDANQKMV